MPAIPIRTVDLVFGLGGVKTTTLLTVEKCAPLQGKAR